MDLLREIYLTIVHFAKDLRSTRIQLVYIATITFLFTLYLTRNAVLCGIVGGWVTVLFHFYFRSKDKEHSKTGQKAE